MKNINLAQFIKKPAVKITLRVVVGLFLFLLLTVITIHIPYVQTKIIQKASRYLSAQTGFKSSISYVNIGWFDTILLEDVNIYDTQDSLMIGVENIKVDLSLNALLFGEEIRLDQAVLEHAKVQLIRNTADNNLNINLFIANINNLGGSKKKGGKAKPFIVNEVQLNDSKFSLYEPNRDTVKIGFDYNHFELSKINANINDFMIAADTVQMEVNQLTTIEQINNFVIKDLSTFFRICNKSLSLQKLKLETEYSLIKDSIVFNYNRIKNLNQFNDSVTINANLSESVIFSKELAIFAPYMGRFEEFYKISGKIRGPIRNLNIRGLQLAFGRDSKIDGNLNIDGLPNWQESLIDLNLKNSNITSKDLFPYVRDNVYQQITRLGDVSFNGQFFGFPYDFVANGTFRTKFGRFDSDINLKVNDTTKTSIYSGNLRTYNFDFGSLIDYPELVQKITMNGNIKGSGLTLEKADFELVATINELGFKNYVYKDIITDARLTKELFNGSLAINDENLRFLGDASIDFRNNNNLIKINARLDTLFTKALGLTNDKLFVATTLNMDMQGNKIDDLVGEASFSNTSLEYQDKSLALDTLHLFSLENENKKTFKLDSKEFSMNAEGDYTFTGVYKDFKQIYKEYLLNFQNHQDELDKYYQRKTINPDNKYAIDYEIVLNDINPYFQLINHDGYVARNSSIKGRFSNGYTSILTVYSHMDTLSYDGNLFIGNDIDLSTSKVADSEDVLAMAYISSNQQVYKNYATTDNISVEGIWNKDKIDFYSGIHQTKSNNHTELNGHLTFLDEAIEIKLDPSDSRIIDKVWRIKENNKITITDKEIIVDSLKIESENQFIAAHGIVSEDLEKKLKLEIFNLKVENLNPLITEELEGTIDGFAEIQGLTSSPHINSQLQVSSFKINNFLLGNIYGLANWENDNNRARLDFEIERLGKRIVDLRGYFMPTGKENQLDLSADFDQADLGVIEPFLDEYITEIKGLGTGEFEITGSLDYPILRGNGYLSDGRVKINYLNTTYYFGGDIFMDDNEIGVRNLILEDDNNQKSTFSGGLFHDGFKNFIVNFEGKINNFKVLDTNAKQNNLYYGTAIVTGDIEILGSFSNLNIMANAVTNKGTKIFIPVNADDEVEQFDFIRFVERKDTTTVAVEDEIESVNIQRLNLEFNLDITPDAYSEIIFDIKSGDIIRGRSNGKLKLQVDPKGDFNMFGNIEIVEGAYNFTLKNIINKEFVISPKSKINWYGDPYGGVLDIQANYTQQAALSPFFNTDSLRERQTPDLKRKYPAKVVLDLQGNLLNPTIDFDLDFKSYPFTLNNAISDISSNLKNDEQELSRQVFSLIMLRKFSPQGTFDLGGGQSVSSSVSELLSNQLSYWITQVDENLEIDVDLGNLDDDAFNTFQLRLSYSFLDGRLRVTRDGGFTDGDNNAGLNSIVGDWTVEYLLTPDGKLKAKMYNKNNYFSLDADQQTSTTAGFSIQYTENFDKISEIWKKVRVDNDNSKNTPVTPKEEEVKSETTAVGSGGRK